MSRGYVYLSFFKTNKIDYIYHSNSETIEFPCIQCGSCAKMCGLTSQWECPFCKQEGNIISLIEFSKHNSFRKMYVPMKEQKSILQMLDRLANKYPDERGLVTVKSKVVDLIRHFEKNTV